MLSRKIEGDSMLFYQEDQLILTVEEPEKDGRVFMILKGELITEVAPHIQDELEAFSCASVPVTVDFKDVTYCSISALDALINSQTFIDSLQHGDLVLRNVPDAIYTMMDKLNIADLFYIDEQGDEPG